MAKQSPGNPRSHESGRFGSCCPGWSPPPRSGSRRRCCRGARSAGRGGPPRGAPGGPGVTMGGAGAALGVALGIAVINAVLPPVLAALRLPFMVGIGFVLVLFANAFALQLASNAAPHALHVAGFGDALLAALVVTAISLVIQVVLGTSDDDEFSLHVT